jgi:hypothetical protein
LRILGVQSPAKIPEMIFGLGNQIEVCVFDRTGKTCGDTDAGSRFPVSNDGLRHNAIADFAGDISSSDQNRGQCPDGISTLTPQTAAAAMAITNVALTSRPVTLLLLQPWSTAASQMKKRTMHPTPSALSHTRTSRISAACYQTRRGESAAITVSGDAIYPRPGSARHLFALPGYGRARRVEQSSEGSKAILELSQRA